MSSRVTKLLGESIALTDAPEDFNSAAVVAITVTGGPLTLTQSDQANNVVGSILLPDGLHFLQKLPSHTFTASANGGVGTSVAY